MQLKLVKENKANLDVVNNEENMKSLQNNLLDLKKWLRKKNSFKGRWGIERNGSNS